MATISIGELEATLRLRDELTAQLKVAQQNLAKTGDTLQRVGRAGKEAGTAMTMGLTLPLVAAAGAALKFSADFQTVMTKVGSLTNIGTGGIAEMRKEILRLSPAVGVGPRELAEGLLVVASTGLKGAEALAVLTQAAKGSAVGLGETKDIARSVTSAITAYGSEVLSAEEASNKLFVAVREGGAEASEFAGTLGRVVGIASQVGVSFDEVLASVATFTRLGVRADEAVTALRGTMGTILKPTKDAREQLVALGTSIEELRRNVKEKGLAVALTDLVALTKGNEDAIAAIIPNVRALAGVLGNAGAQADAYAEILKNVQNGTMELEEAFGEVTKTLGFKWNSALAKAQGVLLQFGDAIAPTFLAVLDAMDQLLEMLAALARAFTALPRAVQTTAVAFGALLAAAGPLTYIISSFIQLTGFAATAVAWLTRVLGLSTIAATANTTALVANAAATTAVATASRTFAASEMIAGMSSASKAAGTAARAITSVVKPTVDLAAAWQLTSLTGLVAAGTFKNVAAGMGASGRAAAALSTAAFTASQMTAGMSASTRVLTAAGVANAVTYTKVAAGMSAAGASAATAGASLSTAARGAGLLRTAMIGVGGLHGAIAAVVVSIGLLALKSEGVRGVLRDLLTIITGGASMVARFAAEWTGLSLKLQALQASAGFVIDWAKALGTAIEQWALPPLQRLREFIGALAAYFEDGRGGAFDQAAEGAKKLGGELDNVAPTLDQALRELQKFDQEMERRASAEAAELFAGSTELKSLTEQLADAKKGFLALTDAQKADIAAGHALKLSVEKIAKETRITDAVVQLYVDTLEDAGKASKELTRDSIEQWESQEKIRQSLLDTVPALERWQAGWRRAGQEMSRATGLPVGDFNLSSVNPGDTAFMNNRQIREMIAAGHDGALAMGRLSHMGQLAGESLDVVGRSSAITAEQMRDMRDAAVSTGDTLKAAFKSLPDLVINALVGGGGLAGAIKAFGVQLGAIFADALTESIKTNVAQGGFDASSFGTGLTGKGLAAAGSLGALTGVGAIASGASGGQALGAVAMGAASVGAGALAAGATAGAAAALGAATLGIGAAAVGIAVLIKSITGVSKAVQEARAQQEQFIANLRTMGIAGFSNFDVISKAAGKAAVLMGYSADAARLSLDALMDTDNPERFRREMERVTKVLERLNKLVEKYELTWKDLASPEDRMNAFRGELDGLLDDFVMLQRAGYDTTTILKAMGPDFMKTLADAKASGVLDGFIDDLVEAGRISKETGDILKNFGKTGPDFAELTERASKYGITLAQLGPAFQQAAISKTANEILTDFNDLIGAGAEINGVMVGMKDEVSKLLQEAIKTGSSIPTAMKPMLETMLRAGLLTDEDGRKLKDLAGINFEDSPLEQGLKDLEAAIRDLIQALGGVPGALANIGNTRIPIIRIPFKYEEIDGDYARGPVGAPAPPPLPPVPPLPPGPGDTEPPTMPRPGLGIEEESIIFDWRRYNPGDYAAQGGYVTELGLQHFKSGGVVLPFRQRGEDTVPIMAKPGEMILTDEQQDEVDDQLRNGGGGDLVVKLVMPDGRLLTEVIIPHALVHLGRNKHGHGTALAEIVENVKKAG